MSCKCKFRDPVVERVVDKFKQRSDVGYKKYGVTLDEDPSKMIDWLNHLQEELMDAILYIQSAMDEVKTIASNNKETCINYEEVQKED